MNNPTNLYYTEKHEWLELDGDKATVGITDHAQDSLGDIVFVSLPAVGDEFAAGDVLAEIESVKAVSLIYSPVSGRVCEVNDALSGAPESINADAYAAWIAKLTDAKVGEGLLTAEEYEKFLSEEEA